VPGVTAVAAVVAVVSAVAAIVVCSGLSYKRAVILHNVHAAVVVTDKTAAEGRSKS
jgi:type IV secretory pathway VirB3-like protein